MGSAREPDCVPGRLLLCSMGLLGARSLGNETETFRTKCVAALSRERCEQAVGRHTVTLLASYVVVPIVVAARVESCSGCVFIDP